MIEQVAGYRQGGDYIFRVQINNMLATIMMNSDPREFTNIKVYAGSPDYAVADVDIKDFEYTPSGSRSSSKTANDECKLKKLFLYVNDVFYTLSLTPFLCMSCQKEDIFKMSFAR